MLIKILCIFFGIGTWLCVNGLWVELPILVQHLPEKWSLPSYMSVIIQLANIAPITITILHSCAPPASESKYIYFVMILGIIALLLLSQFWSIIVQINGVDHSLVFFGLIFILAAVDCSSRVLYLPFMAQFKPELLTYFFIGEGLSGLLPSGFALVQGVGQCNNNATNGTNTTTTPLYSVEVFFYLMTLVSVMSAVAFYCLNKRSVVGKYLNLVKEDSLLQRNYNSTPNTQNGEEMKRKEAVGLMTLLILTCSFSNGIFPSIQSYSSLPFGNDVYHWTVTLSNIANPSVCFLMLLIKKPHKNLLYSTIFASLIVGSYVMYTAISPSVSNVGAVLVVSSWILLVGLFTYVKVTIASIFRCMGKKGLFWTGAFTQLGSAIGAGVAFVLVNFMNVFHSHDSC